MPLFIQTPRFIIREFKPEEEEIYVALYDDEKVIVHLPKRTQQEQVDIFRGTIADYEAGKTLNRWGLFNNGDGDYIGSCLLRNFYDFKDKIELGYSLHQKYWGQGIGTEMAQIMIAHAFSNTDAEEVVAVTTLGNTGSQKVLLKAGMERRDNFHRDGEELAYFGIKRNSGFKI
ncbi:MAG: GNAT family N-acetyltransferase [Bacteroidetes bacterium]|nr:GNAT family N-acetyltransferase [Bacteroidota bacterium]